MEFRLRNIGSTSSQSVQLSLAWKPNICPRRLVMMLCALEVYWFGMAIFTLQIGSSNTGPQFGKVSFIATIPARRNAMSELSTAWCCPSNRLTTGKPSRTSVQYSFTPASTAGIYWRGTIPPEINCENSKPLPRGCGLISRCTSVPSPCPPDCFLCRACCWIAFLIVSL